MSIVWQDAAILQFINTSFSIKAPKVVFLVHLVVLKFPYLR